MPDTQIFRGAVSNVPGVYILPDSVEFVLKAVSAEFVDNGAGADWLPCVTVLSDSGHTIARAADQAVKVTAGDDADVSWFPGVKHFPAATPSGGGAPDTLAIFGVTTVIPSVVGGYSGESPWDAASVQMSGTNVWTYTLDGGGNIVEVKASAHGVYESWCSFHFDAPSGLTNESCIANIFGTIPIPVKQSNISSVTTTGIFEGMVGAMTHFTSGQAIFTMEIDFNNASTGSFLGIEWWLKRWPL